MPAMGRLLSSIARAVRRRPPPNRPAAPGSAEGPLVSYAPARDGDPDPGEVVWAWVPYEDDPSQGKDRPVLVIGHDGGSTGKLLAVPLSSKDPSHKRDAVEWVEVGTGGWDREQRPSFANADRVLRYAAADVRREGAALPRARFDAVVAKVRQLGNLG